MLRQRQTFYTIGVTLVATILAININGCDSSEAISKPPQCGQHCVHRICQLLGVPISIEEVCKMCPPKSEGESLGELKGTFELIGLESRGLFASDRSIDALSELPRPFVASLGGHFIVVDDYDQAQGVLRVFDVEGRRRLAAVPSFLARWDGYTLTVNRPHSSHLVPRAHYDGVSTSSTAIAEFESLYLDAGDVDPESDNEIEYAINVQNAGSEELHILSVKSDCSCISIDTDQKAVSHGASAKIKLKQDASLLRGPYEKHVLIRTNDPVHPLVQITLAGNAGANLVSSHSKIDFGHVQVGGGTTVDVYVRYTGDKALVLEPIELKEGLAIDIKPWNLANELSSDSETIVRQRFNVAFQPKSHIGWSNVFQVSVSITADKAEVGRLLSGEIKMKTNLKSVPTLSIPYVAKVSEPCRARPSTLFFESAVESDSILVDRVIYITVPQNEQWVVGSVLLSGVPLEDWKVKDSMLPNLLSIQINAKLSVKRAEQITSLNVKLAREAPDEQYCELSIPVYWRIR